MRYIKKIGKEHDILANVKEDDLRNMGGHTFHGVIRNWAFRVRGRSKTLHRDFVVTDIVDDLVDVVSGWRFMATEFGVLFEKAITIISDSFIGVGNAVFNFSKKVAKIASAVQRQVTDCISRAPSPSPPYSLCDALAPNFYL